ncbi:nucleoporin NIC96 [Stipitochalara longipes BDJ]|nr:nucleoporin NIC96 [Stipitochalara longipes BDJ]
MSSLFGSLNNPSRPSDNLFKPATSSEAPSNPFGASTTKPATTGLFGSSLGISTSQPQTTGGGAFGGLSTTAAGTPQPTASGSLFGASTQGQQPQAGASLFGQSQPQQQGGLASSVQLPVPQAQRNDQNPAYWDTIVEASRKRAHAESVADDLPQLQLGLGDLRQRIKRVGTGAPDRTANGRAHYLLAASGVDPGAAIRDLNAFTSATGRVDRQQPREETDTDVEGYLANLQTQTTLSMISDGLARSVRDFDAFLEDNVTMEWDAQRRRIYQHFGINPIKTPHGGAKSSFAASSSENPTAFGRSRRNKAAALSGSRGPNNGPESTLGQSNLQKSVIGAAGPIGTGHQVLFTDVEKRMEASGVVAGPQDRFQREKQSKYAEKVQNLNVARLQKRPYPVCYEFSSVVKQAADQHAEELVKAYRTLSEIVGEDPEVKSLVELSTAKERGFADAYLDDSPNSAKHTAVKKAILRGSAKALEKLQFERMEEEVAKNPRDAALGGVPNVINKVKAYVRLQAIKKNLSGDNSDLQLLGDDYVWALIYYLIRTGHVKEADDFVHANAVAFRAIDRNFAAYIRDYATSNDRRLREDLQARIRSEYNQRLRIAPENSIDPYRMACYKLIGRCDLAERALEGIKCDIEDFVWIQIVLARELSRVEAMASEVYGLDEARTTIRNIGERYFSKGGAEVMGKGFGTYVFLQVALGMFEDAVSYLYTYSYVDGVHLAIALDFYGLLRVSNPTAGIEELCSLTTRGQPQINFGIMVGLYTRDFRAANVSAAVDYLTLICLNKDLQDQAGSNQVALCHEALRELVLESREFALLLGDMREDGQRIKGVIEERMRLIGLDERDDFMRRITMQAASVADDNGRTTDAVLLYHLAGEYDNVIVIVNRALSEAIAVSLGEERMRIEPLKARADADATQQRGTESSLTTVDDPIVLAQRMKALYDGNAMFSSRVNGSNLVACGTLLEMSAAKDLVEKGEWARALDIIATLDILPLKARGNSSVIRNLATKFASLSQPVAHNVPNLLMWTIISCNRQRANLASAQFGGNEGTRQSMIDDLKQVNMDLTTYTSQLRYRFPANLHEALARAQSE